MDSSDIVNRIMNLKKMSVELKESTENKDGVDIHLIKSIMGLKKEPQKQTTKSKEFRISNTNLGPQLNGNSETKKVNSGVLSHLINHEISERTKTITEEEKIDRLKKQNQDLQETLLKLNQELEQLDELEKISKEEKWKDGLPYFTLQDQFQVFITKLTIHQKDHDKIDYTHCLLSLTVDKITLSKKGKKPRALTFTNLQGVYYLDNHVMLLQFNIQGDNSQSVFIRFPSEEKLNSWDMGIYINFKIMESMKKENFIVFEQQSLKNSETGIKEERIKEIRELSSKQEEKSQISDKEHIRIQVKEVEKNLPKKKQEPEKTPSIPFIKYEKQSSEESQIKEKKNVTIQKAEEDKKAKQKGTQNSEEINNKRVEASEIKKDSEQKLGLEQVQKLNSIRPHKKSNRSQNEVSKQLERITRKRNQASNKNKQEEIKNITEKIEEKKKEIEEKKEQKKEEKEFENFEEGFRFKNIEGQLESGYGLVKYAVNGFQPHEKTVYLNQKGDKLCWVDKGSSKSSSSKYVLISSIVDVNQGQSGEAIKKFVSPIKEPNRFVTITLNSKDRKTLEFSAKTSEIMRDFCFNLKKYKQKKNQKS